MAYTVFARKYRPQTFGDLVGQEPVARTLGNALASGRIAHAFLFTGARGVGKTTTARLLAKALCCEKGPTASPCNACPICADITSGTDMDVLEIDGASNNSVDDVRRLQETLPFQPTRNRFRIVIVDEVHMLSTGAFNAFLKTLEEPPAHVKFIFATTEAHKVPITIRSRCQRYDFRLIPQADVASRVRHILSLESVEADDAAVALVAREAAGSLRDALTLLDQVVALAGNRLEGAALAQALGIADRDAVHRAASALLEGDPARALSLADEVTRQGADPLHFVRQLATHLRDLTVLAVTHGEAGDLVDLANEELAAARTLSAQAGLAELQRAFGAVSALVDEVARSSVPRTVLEMGLVRAAARPRLVELQTLIARIEGLAAGGGGAPSPGRAGSGGGPSRPRSSEAQAAPRPSGAHAAAPSPAPSPSPTSEEQTAPGHRFASTPPPAPAKRPAPPSVSPAPTTTSPAPTGDTVTAWAQIVGAIRESKPAFGAILEHAVPVEVSAERLVLSFTEGAFYGRQASSPESEALLVAAATRCFGAAPKVEVRTHREAAGRKSVAELEAERRADAQEETRRRALNHPRVIEVMQVFPDAAGNVTVQTDD